MDRRIVRTRNSLIQALPELMMRYEWDTINVQLLCDHADVSRSAFYTHFKNKSDVLDQCFIQLENELLAPVSGRGLDQKGTLLYLPNLLSHVESHCELLERNSTSTAGLVILNRFKLLLNQLTTREFSKSKRFKLKNDQLAFITGGIFSMLEQWSKTQCRTSAKILTSRIDSIVGGFLTT